MFSIYAGVLVKIVNYYVYKCRVSRFHFESFFPALY
jgi:hypothetical protein